MSNTIALQDWLDVIHDEYLSTFIKEGWSSIKFAVTPDELKPDLYAAMENVCQELGYVFVELDAGARRVHMPQDIFFGIANQLDWRVMARRHVLRLASEKGYQVGGVTPEAVGNIFEAIAKRNSLEANFLRIRIEQEIQNKVLKNTKMARDFRVAMMHLCLNEETRDGGGYSGQPILDWLTGVNQRVSSVHPFKIYTAINRTTARYFVESALYWVRQVGCSGTVILLDNSRVTLSSNPKDCQRYYTKPMTMDHYELLREFVDGVDGLSGTLLVVVTNSEFVDENSPRGYGIYQALRTRVMDDVRDKNLVNPVAPLVRLSQGGSVT